MCQYLLTPRTSWIQHIFFVLNLFSLKEGVMGWDEFHPQCFSLLTIYVLILLKLKILFSKLSSDKLHLMPVVMLSKSREPLCLGQGLSFFPRILSKSIFSPFVAFEGGKRVIMLEHCNGK